MTLSLSARFGLNAEFDATAPVTRKMAPERLLILGVAAATIAPLFGVRTVLAWALAAGLAEAWLIGATAPALMARRLGLARVQRLAATVALSGCWAGLGVLLWRLGHTPARLGGVAVLLIAMLYAVEVGFRSPAQMAAIMAPVTATLLVLPFSYAGSLEAYAMLQIIALGLTAYIVRSAVGAHRRHRRLQETLDELVAQREAAQLASQAKSDFLATISHEIRNPLNGVLGMAQAIGQDELPPAQHERLAVLQESGRAVLSLLNDLLDLSTIEAGRLELEPAAFDLPALARALQVSFEPQCAARGVALRMTVEASAAGFWLGDAARIRQVVANLLSNAAKFTARGEIACRFAYAAPDLTIEVRDTGAGIGAAHLAGLFDRYALAGAGLRDAGPGGGPGLGLSVVRQLCELMQGEVAVDSKVGRGSTFTVRLPLAPAEAPPAATAPAPDAQAAQPLGLRVLAADDHPVNRLVLATLLGQAGLDATVVENAPLLISLWEAAEVDVILLDVEMPLVDGLEAARRIRAREAAAGRRRTPIIALTGNLVTDYAADHAAAGMDGVLAKPIEAASLLRTLAAAAATVAPDEQDAPELRREA